MKTWIRALAMAMSLSALASTAGAQAPYPNRNVRLLVPFAAGGSTDILARMLGEELAKMWNQPVVIENRPGAGGVVASQVVATAPADGYTLILIASGHATNPHLYTSLPYDTFRDFTPIAHLATSPNLVLVKTDSPFKTFAELLAAARAKPASLSYGVSGTGTSTHLAGELIKHIAQVDVTAIAYRGGAPVLNDLVGGHIPFSINATPEALGHVQAGTLRVLAVTTGQRAAFLPDAPTISEAGIPGYDTGVWWGVVGPGNLPAAIVAKLEKDIGDVFNTPAMRARLAKVGATPMVMGAAAFAELVRAEHAKWGPIVKAAKITAE